MLTPYVCCILLSAVLWYVKYHVLILNNPVNLCCLSCNLLNVKLLCLPCNPELLSPIVYYVILNC